MSSFQVEFDRPLSSIVATDAHVATLVVDVSAQHKGPDGYAELVQTVQSLETRLSEIQQEIQSQNRLVTTGAIEYALEIARAVLQTDDELVQQRLNGYVEMGLAQNDQAVEPHLFVHPQCKQSLESWLAQNTESHLTLTADDSLIPGDCRIDFGDLGLLATLDSQVELVGKKLKQLVAGRGVQT